MANRRQGYGGGRHNFNSGPVNPWQGGNVPGGGQFNANNLMSQLSEPQAQLALALTKLLQPQQQVPSLLSMNTLPPMQGGGGGGYGHNRNFRGGPGPNLNRRPQNNMNKPFNNNKMQNRNNDGFRRRPRANSKNKSTVASNKPQRSSPAASKSNKTSSPTKASSKPSGSEASKTSDTSVKGETDDTQTPDKETDDKSENLDGKREWKEEKSGTQDEDNENEDAKEGSEDADAENEDSNDNEKTDESGDKKACRYEGIPKELLHCFICQKVMWDPESFEKHMNGRAHQQMFEKVEESYRIKSDMMREAIRLSEEKNNIEMDRMKRLGKKTKQQMLSRCAMCDLDFYGQLFLHRKSPGHQKLKHFLHPKCQYCNKEFPNRMEWENHRHTAEHLRKKVIADKKEGAKIDIEDMDDGVMLEDECFVVIDSIEAEDLEEANVVVDITDEDLKDVSINIPTYKQNRAVGLSLIKPITGYFCKPCSKFFLTEKASHQHATGKTHYSAFVKILNEKVAENEKKRKMSVGDEEEDDEGNWKRRKASKEGEEVEEEKGDGDEPYDPLEAADTNDESLKMDTANSTADLNNTSLDDESFLTTADPNDITLNVSNNESAIINDVTWNEVDSKIDEILEDHQPEEKPSPAVSPAKGRSARPQRATRGRKSN